VKLRRDDLDNLARQRWSVIEQQPSIKTKFTGPPRSRKCLPAIALANLGIVRNPAQADRMRPWFSHPKSKVEWSNTGHWIMQDRKDGVNALVTAWIHAL
jgi:hypothetical protein